MPKWTTAAEIDAAVQDHRLEWLAQLVTDATLGNDVREHLANTIEGLLAGRIKPPRRRPPKRGLEFDQRRIGERVWKLKRDEGWTKVSAAVAHVADTLKMSPRKVWQCWRSFDRLRYEMQREKPTPC